MLPEPGWGAKQPLALEPSPAQPRLSCPSGLSLDAKLCNSHVNFQSLAQRPSMCTDSDMAGESSNLPERCTPPSLFSSLSLFFPMNPSLATAPCTRGCSTYDSLIPIIVALCRDLSLGALTARFLFPSPAPGCNWKEQVSSTHAAIDFSLSGEGDLGISQGLWAWEAENGHVRNRHADSTWAARDVVGSGWEARKARRGGERTGCLLA